MTRGSWWGKLALVGIAFVAGALLGAAGMYRGIERRIHERLDSATWAPRTMTWLDKELSLTDEQRTKCEPIVRDAVNELVELRDQAETERKAIVSKMFLDIYAAIPAEQQRRLEEAIRKNRGPSTKSKQ